MTADLSTWLTKQQAADAIGVSTKAIERFARAGKLEQASRPQKGSPDVAVYFPDDVAQLAAARRPTSPTGFLVPDLAPPSNGNGHRATGVLERRASGLPELLSSGDDLLKVLVTAAARLVSETSQTPARFLTLAEASAYCGLSQAYLKRAIAAGTLPAIRDRGWRIRRTDLEAL